MSTSNYFAFLSQYTVKSCNCSHFYAESSITQKSKQKSLGVLLHKSRFTGLQLCNEKELECKTFGIYQE